jgi:hypothetical protein
MSKAGRESATAAKKIKFPCENGPVSLLLLLCFLQPCRLEINERERVGDATTGRSRRYCTTSNQIQPASQSQVHYDTHSVRNENEKQTNQQQK